jgi:hypothetical protein
MNAATQEALLPGADLVAQGLADLARNKPTELAFLVLIAAPRLRSLGIPIPDPGFPRPSEHQLYSLLEQRLGTAAHSHYNSLIRRIVSYAQALEREQSQRESPPEPR